MSQKLLGQGLPTICYSTCWQAMYVNLSFSGWSMWFLVILLWQVSKFDVGLTVVILLPEYDYSFLNWIILYRRRSWVQHGMYCRLTGTYLAGNQYAREKRALQNVCSNIWIVTLLRLDNTTFGSIARKCSQVVILMRILHSNLEFLRMLSQNKLYLQVLSESTSIAYGGAYRT